MKVLTPDWMLVGGLDPGTRHVGAAIVAVRGQDLQLVDAKRIPIVGATIEKRLKHVGEELRRFFPNSNFRMIAVERAYVGKNHGTSLVVAMAAGVCVEVASAFAWNVHLVRPQEARKAIGVADWGGKRKEVKERVRGAIKTLLGLDRELTEDESDACAPAVWAANRVWQTNQGLIRAM